MKLSKPTADEQVRIRFSQAVLRAERKRHDLGPFIAEGHRARISRDTKDDPTISLMNLQVALKAAGDTPITEAAREAHRAHVESVLHIWYRIPSDLRSEIILAAQELAMLANENPDHTLVATLNLVHGARSAGDALSEQKAANTAKAENRRREKAKQKDQRLRKRLQEESLRAS